MTGDGRNGRARRVADRLLEWFGSHDRDVPWRDEERPYRVWVAEVMAQQTRMETVRDYYGPFLERFPDVGALADAGLEEVLKAWEGLGYYARARNLHRAARRVVEEHGGEFPRDAELLRELPGIGPYTAGAVASMAFGEPVPAVDGNARRVLSRLFDLERPSAGALEAAAAEILDARPRDAAALNQALMDLGGAVCTPRDPACGECPVRGDCLALERGTVSRRPPPRSRSEKPHHDIGVGVVRHEGRVLISRRPPEGLLGGLWEFPGGKVEAGESPPETVRRELREELGIEVEVGDRLIRVEHAYSHLRVTLHVHGARLVSGEPEALEVEEWRWVNPGRLRDHPFPAANQEIIDRLELVEGAAGPTGRGGGG